MNDKPLDYYLAEELKEDLKNAKTLEAVKSVVFRILDELQESL